MTKYKKSNVGDMVVILYGNAPAHKQISPQNAKFYLTKGKILKQNDPCRFLIERCDGSTCIYHEDYLRFKLSCNCPEYLK